MYAFQVISSGENMWSADKLSPRSLTQAVRKYDSSNIKESDRKYNNQQDNRSVVSLYFPKRSVDIHVEADLLKIIRLHSSGFFRSMKHDWVTSLLPEEKLK